MVTIIVLLGVIVTMKAMKIPRLLLKSVLGLVLFAILCQIGKTAVRNGKPYKKDEFKPLEGANRGSALGIDINESGKEELTALSGIGEVYAENIVSAREEMGKFKSVDDLLSAQGVGVKRLQKIENSIKIK